MKLRLETGNFSIKGTVAFDAETQAATATFDPLPTGLNPIDFIGVLVETESLAMPSLPHNFAIVCKTGLNMVDGTIDLYTSDPEFALYYDPLTGKVGSKEDSSSGGGDVIH